VNNSSITNDVGIHLTTIMHSEFRTYEKPGPK